jgi:hypothetical protein
VLLTIARLEVGLNELGFIIGRRSDLTESLGAFDLSETIGARKTLGELETTLVLGRLCAAANSQHLL